MKRTFLLILALAALKRLAVDKALKINHRLIAVLDRSIFHGNQPAGALPAVLVIAAAVVTALILRRKK